ncbi:PHP domain-containing protein [Halorarum halobium]|uniref:PHP domain-containing protein n=1 Tax=Halorarum halobium TaxID=3075121 RepID=UPI0028A711DC|nr:PHP domain-containing protein [Halobaculum sp. XH14]
MKRWRRYDGRLASGLWHVHTERTDGENSVTELVAFADDRGFPLLGITEHVRREPTYDFDALYEEGKRAAAAADLECAVGCEAKVLDADGTLDASEGTLDRADVVYAAYHGTPFSRDEYLESVHAMLENPAVDVWAHPWSYADGQGYEIDADERAAVLEAVRENDVLFELNVQRPPDGFDPRTELRDVRTVVGYDLHDLDRWQGKNERVGRSEPEDIEK